MINNAAMLDLRWFVYLQQNHCHGSVTSHFSTLFEEILNICLREGERNIAHATSVNFHLLIMIVHNHLLQENGLSTYSAVKYISLDQSCLKGNEKFLIRSLKEF